MAGPTASSGSAICSRQRQGTAPAELDHLSRARSARRRTTGRPRGRSGSSRAAPRRACRCDSPRGTRRPRCCRRSRRRRPARSGAPSSAAPGPAAAPAGASRGATSPRGTPRRRRRRRCSGTASVPRRSAPADRRGIGRNTPRRAGASRRGRGSARADSASAQVPGPRTIPWPRHRAAARRLAPVPRNCHSADVHGARRFLVWWVVLLVLWFLLVSTNDGPYLIVGLVCSALSALAALLAHDTMHERYALNPRWLVWFVHAVPSTVADTVRLTRLLFRSAELRRAGQVRELTLPKEGPRHAAGRRALAVVVLGLAPGSYVATVDGSRLLLHEQPGTSRRLPQEVCE